MTWPAVVALILMILATLPRSPYVLLYLFFSLGPFVSLSLIPGDVSGSTILPQSACAVFLVCKLLLSKGQVPRAFDAVIDPAKLSLLFAFLFYGLFSAYVMPLLGTLVVGPGRTLFQRPRPVRSIPRRVGTKPVG